MPVLNTATDTAKAYPSSAQLWKPNPLLGHRIVIFGGRQIYVTTDDASYANNPTVTAPSTTMLRHAR